MRGNNELRLNTGSMIQIVERWMIEAMPEVMGDQEVADIQYKDNMATILLKDREVV